MFYAFYQIDVLPLVLPLLLGVLLKCQNEPKNKIKKTSTNSKPQTPLQAQSRNTVAVTSH